MLFNMAKPQQTVFYSWQSDSPPKANRYFIQSALERAVRKLASKGNIAVEPVVDRDTRNVAGAPKIAETIFAKIERAAVFVADVSIVGKTLSKTAKERKALPNPNVLMELGYALKVLEDQRLILIANTAFGRIEDLPFDLLGRRTLPYTLREKNLVQNAESQKIRKRVRDQLQVALEAALESIFLLPPRDLNQLPAPLLILEGAKSLRDKAANAIGPRGTRTTLIRIGERERTITRDGLAITSQLTNQDHHTRHGIDLLAKAAEEVRQQVGDGAKSAILLCYEMVNSGYAATEAGELPSDVINGMERAVERTVNYINKVKKPLRSDGIPNVAGTAGGPLAAKLVVEAFEKAKPEGVWMVQHDSVPAKSTVTVEEGIVFNRGYIAEDFANDPATGACVLDNCLVVVCEDKIYSYQSLLPILQQIVSAKQPVLVLAEDIEGEALKLLVQNHNKNVLSCVAVKAPAYDQSRKDWLRDIATVVGAQLFGGLYGKSLESADLSDLGVAERVVVDKDETQITPGQVNQDRIAIRRAQIQKEIQQTASYERDKLQSRLANLIGSTAVIKVGGPTRDELIDNAYKVTTAMHSVRWALGQGYVLGGGLTYYNAHNSLNKDRKVKSLTQGEKFGIKAVQRALREPIMSLLRTGGQSIVELKEQSNVATEVGFNLITQRYENLREAGVWDAAVVASSAVQIAFSHAKMILETTSWDTIRPNLPFL
jgi:chaperonin GroEL